MTKLKAPALALAALLGFAAPVLAQGAGQTGHGSQILLSLFIVFVSAQLGAEASSRLKLPSVVGEIAAGVLVGPGALGWVEVNEPLQVLAEIGAVLLLFSVGLETRVGDLKKVGRVALQVGTLGLILPFVLGALWALAAGFAPAKSLFIAAAFVATSAGITARVLGELGVLARVESRVILGAAVIDDILAMLLLGIVTALSGGGRVDVAQLGLVFGQAVGFVALIAFVGTRLSARRGSAILDGPISAHSPLTVSLALCLGLAALAARLGLAAIIGAFLAGMVAAETRQRQQLERQMQVIMAFLVPFFFVVTGAQVQLGALGSASALCTLAFITLLAVVGKLLGCGLGARSLGMRSALIVGVGMVPRGEVGIIVASLGRSSKVFSDEVFALIIAMSLLTSIIAPPVLKLLFARLPRGGDDANAEAEHSLLSDVDEAGHGLAS